MTYPGNWVTKVVPNPNGRALVGAAEEAALLFDGFEVVSFHEPGFDLDVGDAGFGTPLAADWAIPSAAHHSAAIEWQDGDLGPPRPEGSGPRGFDAPPQIFTDADDSHVLPERVRAPEPHGDGTRGRAQDASPELTGAGFESASGQALPPFEEVEQNYDGVMELSQVAGADLPDFQVMDTNQDGALDSTEFYQGGAQISFEELDQNSDGMISEQELAAHGEEIVVIGTAGRSFLGIPEFYFGPGYEYDDFYDWYYGGGGGDGSGTVADTPTVTLNLTNQDNLAAAQQTKAVMEGNIAQLTTMINNLDDSDVITLADGTVASGAQIKAWWSGIDFEITDANYGANRAGVFQNGMSSINFSAYDIYASLQNGGTFILLHELIHSTSYAGQIEATNWSLYLGSVAASLGKAASELTPSELVAAEAVYSQSEYFWESEEFANISANAIAQTLGVAITWEPQGGYEYGDLTQ